MVIIYALYCRASGVAYIGSTKTKKPAGKQIRVTAWPLSKRALAKRFREHRCLLNSGEHKTSRLLEEWRRFGADQFDIVILEVLGDDNLENRRAAEVRWMDSYAERGLLANEHRISMQPAEEARRRGVANAHNDPGKRWTQEVNEKRRQALLGKSHDRGAKISATKRRPGSKTIVGGGPFRWYCGDAEKVGKNRPIK